MPNYTTFEASDYGERILVRRVVLNKDVSREALVLYARLMNDFPNIASKKPVSSLSGGHLSVKCYAFNDGYIIDARLTQTRHKNLMYLFLNPFKEGENVIQNLFENGYIRNEKNLAVCKERILFSSQFNKTSSSFVGLEKISTPYHEIYFDEIKLKEIKEEDLSRLEKEILASKTGDYILFGADDGKTFSTLAPYEKEPSLEKGVNLVDFNQTNAVEDESLMLIFSHKEVTTTSMKSLLSLVLKGLAMAVEEVLVKRVFVELKIQTRMLDKNHSLLVLTSPKGKIEQIKEVLPFVVKGVNTLAIDNYFDRVYPESKVQEVLFAMDDIIYLDSLIANKDLALKDETSEIKKTDYTALNSSFVLDDLLVIRKEINNA